MIMLNNDITLPNNMVAERFSADQTVRLSAGKEFAMMFEWNKDTIRWYTAANEYTGFYGNMANCILPSLADCETLCDLGCGLGLIDLELCHALKRIDCVDINTEAIASLNESIKTRGVKNIFPRLADCSELNETWDAVFMSFFGSGRPDRFLHYCKKLIMVVRCTGKAEMFPSASRNRHENTVESAEQYLIENGVHYKLALKSFEFGQPFTSMDDARNFIKSHAPETSGEEMDEFLAGRLKHTENSDYPLFMPRMKSFGIFELEGAI